MICIKNFLLIGVAFAATAFPGSAVPSALPADKAALLAPHLEKIGRVVFTKHHELGTYHQKNYGGLLPKRANYAYTEAQSDGEYKDREEQWHPGTSLNLLKIDAQFNLSVEVLLEDKTGMIRDPDVSWDGKKILFAWKKSMFEDDYHLYEMDADTRQVRQLTFGLGFADYEGAYLPNGDIVFNSTRCVQVIDCNHMVVGNLYIMDGDGKYMRRVGFDQVHTNFPTVASDGTVLYTRWEYNDRGQIYVQPLFQMFPDGTGQTEYYGNNSWFPTSILHARNIPGTSKALAILSGHHTNQKGKLGIIDPSKGRQESSGVTQVSPVKTFMDTIKVDSWGIKGDQWAYPYPLDEDNYLVTFAPEGAAHWGIYFMNRSGERVLLASDPDISCNQAIPLRARNRPNIIPPRVDYSKHTGVFTMEDIYIGSGLRGVQRGTVKKLRVVEIIYRASAAFGRNGNSGPGGFAAVTTPVGISDVSWDAKRILGETPVYEDGSAAFIVPSRAPVYFQAIDAKGYVVQTMRSWSTLMPGEVFSCVGCHEDKNEAVPMGKLTMAMRAGPQNLTPFHNTSEQGFSYPKFVQPIFNEKCVSCHENANGIDLRAEAKYDKSARKSWNQSYLSLLKGNKIDGNARKSAFVNWVSPQSTPPVLWPYETGSSRSPLMKLLEQGHEGVTLTREEFEKIAAWIDLAVPHAGEYTEGMNEGDKNSYLKKLQKRLDWEKQEAENIQAYLALGTRPIQRPELYSGALGSGLTVHAPGGRVFHSLPAESGCRPGQVLFFDGKGLHVRTLRPESGHVYWDGRNKYGRFMPSGVYLFQAGAYSGQVFLSEGH